VKESDASGAEHISKSDVSHFRGRGEKAGLV
jgi:hypothetical protein